MDDKVYCVQCMGKGVMQVIANREMGVSIVRSIKEVDPSSAVLFSVIGGTITKC